MKNKHIFLIVGVVLIVLIGLFLIGSFMPSEEAMQFTEDLPQYNENLEIYLANINTEFYNFDAEYGVGILNYVITDSIVSGMEKQEDDIKEQVSEAEQTISDYQNAKNSISLNELTDEEADIVNEMDEKISEYNSNKDKINSCLSKMDVYRQWIVLVNENAILLEKFDTQTNLLGNYVVSEKYQDALNKTTEVQNIAKQIKANVQKREATGVQKFSNALSSWDLLIASYDTYREYINLLIKKDYNKAETKYTEYSKKYAEAIAEGAKEEATASEIVNEADTWYQDNIGVCFGLFEEYA